MAAQVLDGRGGGGHDLLDGGRDPHAAEPGNVALALDHRVVRREPNRDAGLVQRPNKLARPPDRLEAAIDDPVQVEDDEADALRKRAHAAG